MISITDLFFSSKRLPRLFGLAPGRHLSIALAITGAITVVGLVIRKPPDRPPPRMKHLFICQYNNATYHVVDSVGRCDANDMTKKTTADATGLDISDHIARAVSIAVKRTIIRVATDGHESCMTVPVYALYFGASWQENVLTHLGAFNLGNVENQV